MGACTADWQDAVKENSMAVPWLVVGQLVLGNLDKIIGVVKPAFTRRKVEALPTQTDLLNQQIVELQTASSNNAEQIGQLAAQLKEFVATVAQGADEAAAQRASAQRLARVAVGLSIVAVLVAATPWIFR
jgi:methyl-accepting chemotaxis protein